MAADSGRQAPREAIEFYRAAGWDDAAIERYQERFGAFGEMIYPLPVSYHRIADGDTLRLGAHEWTVVVGSGHSPEHACLYCPQLKLLIAGDQVLPKISSNVSVYPVEPDADPLGDWLRSLAVIKQRIPDEVLVLPAHNSPFHGLHARIEELGESHVQGLARLQEMLRTPRRTVDVFAALFSRPISRDSSAWPRARRWRTSITSCGRAGRFARSTRGASGGGGQAREPDCVRNRAPPRAFP